MTNRAALYLQSGWPDLSYDASDADSKAFYSDDNGPVGKGDSVFHRMQQKDVFMLAMAIGWEMHTRIRLESPSRSIGRDTMTEEDVWLMCSVAIAEEDPEVLGDPGKLVGICEEYANGGIHALMSIHGMSGKTRPFEESAMRLLDTDPDS